MTGIKIFLITVIAIALIRWLFDILISEDVIQTTAFIVGMTHQLIAAKLNEAHGADPADTAQATPDANAIIGGLVIPPNGSGYLPPGQTSELVETLTQYNEGTIGPGHCDD